MSRVTKVLYLLVGVYLLAGVILLLWDPSRKSTDGTEDSGLDIHESTAMSLTRESPPLPEVYYDIKPILGDLDEMHERRVIRVLTVYSVGRYYIDDALERGLIKESSSLFEDFVNKQAKRKHGRIHVIVVPVARDQLIPALLEGRGDIIQASLSITPERQELIDFSIPASKPLSEVLITGQSAPSIQTIEDLAGQTLYLRHSSSYRESVEDLNRRFREKGLPPINVEVVSELLEDDDLAEMVNAGLLPWAIVDDYKMQWWEDSFPQLVAREDIVLRSGARTAWAFRKNSPLLEKAINQYLEKNKEGTLVGNVLRNRYIRDFDWAENALASDEYERFEELKPLFQKYGEKYSIEYLMLAAQGYQESRLNQKARSRSGALGVMQVKTSTAADPNVDIDGIHTVEGNIHAGAKYLDFLRRRYFSDPDIDERNQILLALAAYNMGPLRMINLRRSAVKLGYNPNIWFDNVELAAARYVGQEPVQYVAKIFKYYLAYRMSAVQMLRRKSAREGVGLETRPET